MFEIMYEVDAKSSIVLDTSTAPFDGKPVLIKLASGWCEAWWDGDVVKSTHPETEGDILSGWNWVCMDDDFQAEFDEPSHWAPLPKIETEGQS